MAICLRAATATEELFNFFVNFVGRKVGTMTCLFTHSRWLSVQSLASAVVVFVIVLGGKSADALNNDRVRDFRTALTEDADAKRDSGLLKIDQVAGQLASWIDQTQDHRGKPFFLIDKFNATLYVFDRHARLRARTPVLLGAAIGDHSVPGIGMRPMNQIRPFERTTPAGRFIAEVGYNTSGEDVVWVDHDAAVSMHRLRTGTAHEKRAQRMASRTVTDNRITYGCINVPVGFYNMHVQPAFISSAYAIVYVLPETRSLRQQFGFPAPLRRLGRR